MLVVLLAMSSLAKVIVIFINVDIRWWLMLVIDEVCIGRWSAWYVVMLMLVMNNVLW